MRLLALVVDDVFIVRVPAVLYCEFLSVFHRAQTGQMNHSDAEPATGATTPHVAAHYC